MIQACRAVQVSLVTGSSVREGKLRSLIHPCPPTCPAGVQKDRTCQSSPSATTTPGLPSCRRARPTQPVGKLLGSHSGSCWGFSQAAAPPRLPRTVLIRPRRRAPAPQPIINQLHVGSWGGCASAKRKTSAVSVTPNEGRRRLGLHSSN